MTKMAVFECGNINPGSVTTLWRLWQRATTRGTNVSVPCGDCTACCRSLHLKADLTAEEAKRFDHVIDEELGPILPKREDGSCVHLIDNKCSVYADRPRCCRTYDCRANLLIGFFPEGDEVLVAALKRWAGPRVPTEDDRILLMAIRLAVMDGGIPTSFDEAWKKARNATLYRDQAKQLAREFRKLPKAVWQAFASQMEQKLHAAGDERGT